MALHCTAHNVLREADKVLQLHCFLALAFSFYLDGDTLRRTLRYIESVQHSRFCLDGGCLYF